MNSRASTGLVYGPWLVGLGAALWGTESAWRIPLNQIFDAEVIVFWEHIFIFVMFLPILLPHLSELRKLDIRTWSYLLFSGFAGSAVGTIFFTLALKHGNPTVVNVILNIQPLISTFGALLLFPDLIRASFEQAGLTAGTGYALICAFFWGGSTVAGRGVMTGMPLRFASAMRIVVGLFCMTMILLAYGKLHSAALWPATAQAHSMKAILLLLLLASISGGIPLLIYFAGLRLTRASTAGYFEMLQTLAAVCITWGFFHAALRPHQIAAAIVLIAAVAMVQRVQAKVEAK